MKRASEILYTIGRVFSYIYAVSSAIVILVGVLLMVLPKETEQEQTALLAMGIAYLIMGIIMLVCAIVTIILASKASKTLRDGDTSKKPHIIMIVIGALGDTFYLIGGILGVIVATRASNNAQ